MNIFTIEELKDTITLFSRNQANFLSENCIVALEHNQHRSGCVLKLDGDTTEDIQLQWSSEIVKNGYKEEKKFIEKSAEALSFFLCRYLTEFNLIEEASIGTGIDYWLGYDKDHDLFNPANFLQARLEISGINSEAGSNTLESRVKAKKQQTVPTDGTQLPAYISVIEHSTPKAHFSKK